MYALLSQLKIAVLDSQRKEAKLKYNEALRAYVIRYFGRPLEKLNVRYIFIHKEINKYFHRAAFETLCCFSSFSKGFRLKLDKVSRNRRLVIKWRLVNRN